MELTWYGLGCFRIMERGYPAVVTDPFLEDETGLSLPRAKADIVTSSELLEEPAAVISWKGLRGVSRTLAGPGEYEIGGVFITGVATFRDQKRGAERGQNVVYSININGVGICHLGELGSVPNQTQVEAMGNVNVLLVPVGVKGGLTPSMISEVISMIEPDVVVPMNYKTPELTLDRDTVTRFLKEMGVTQVKTEESLKISSSGEETEETQVVLLEPQSYD